MSALAATLTVDSFAEIAKTMLKPIRCESTMPEVCTVILSCWEALRLHYLKVHCAPTRENREGPMEYRCTLARCNAPLHNSRESLEQHINLSHMSRIPLPCPFRQCASANPHRSQTFLIDHLQALHADCQGRTVVSLHEEFSPSWRPSCLPPLLPPPPLPHHHDPAGVLVTVMLPPHQIFLSPAPAHHLSRASTLPPENSQSPRKSRIPRQITSESLIDSDEEEIIFDDLTNASKSNEDQDQDFVVWHRPEMLNKDVSRAVHLNDHSHCSEPPVSILYDVFSKKFDELLKSGVVANESG